MQRRLKAAAAAPAFDWAHLQREAQEWAETLEAGTRKPVVAFGEIYATGGEGVYDMWQSEALDMPRHVAVELMRWLKARADAEIRGEGGQEG